MTTERKKDAKVTHHKSKQQPLQSTAAAAAASSSPISETHTPTYSNVAAAASSERQDPISKSTATQSTTTPIPYSTPQPQSQPQPQPPSKPESQPRQVIAVSASKNPAAFFNLARRFLVTDEFCDLSALEGAIVSAVDAAHLLERSKLARIVRIQTSYVTVEPRSKSSGIISDASTTTPAALASSETTSGGAAAAASTMPTGTPQHPQAYPQSQPPPAHHHHHHHHQEHPIPHKPSSHTQGKKSNPLRRSRIIITVQRTQDYTTWLKENESAGEEGHVHAHAPPFAASTPEPS